MTKGSCDVKPGKEEPLYLTVVGLTEKEKKNSMPHQVHRQSAVTPTSPSGNITSDIFSHCLLLYTSDMVSLCGTRGNMYI